MARRMPPPEGVDKRERAKHRVAVEQKLPQRGFGHSFSRVASKIAEFTGRPWAFLTAMLVIAVWAITGPIFGFSDTWQLVINTGTTVVTFLMVFLIQNTQNRDSQAIQLKLNELLRSVKGAHTALLDIEELSQGELDVIKREYEDLASSARKALRNGQ